MRIEQPISVIGAPRSGTTLLFSILSSHPDLWSLYREGWIIERYLHPETVGWQHGNALGAEDASEPIVRLVRSDYYRSALNYQALSPASYSAVYTNRFRERLNRKLHQVLAPLLKPRTIRIVDKSPKNCLRIPFLDAVFPDVFFVFLTREPCANLSSLLEGWRQIGRYETYHLPGGLEIEGYAGRAWNFLLPPGWENYSRGASLAQVCAFQYRAANQAALAGLSRIPKERQATLRYEDLVARPEECVPRLCEQVGLTYRGGLKRMAEEMPPVNTASPPNDEKWRKNEREVLSVLAEVREVAEALGYQR